MLTPREKCHLPEKISEEDRTHAAASSRTVSPTHYQLSYSGPFHDQIPLKIVVNPLCLAYTYDRNNQLACGRAVVCSTAIDPAEAEVLVC